MSQTQYSINNLDSNKVFRNIPGARVIGVWADSQITFPTPFFIQDSRSVDIHMFEEMTFSSNIPSSVYQNALQSTPLVLEVYFQDEHNLVTREAIVLNQYFQGLNLGMSHTPTKARGEGAYYGIIRGALNQTPELIDAVQDELILPVSFTVASITSKPYSEKNRGV